MDNIPQTRKSADIHAVMLDANGATHSAVIDQLDNQGLHMKTDEYSAAIGDRVDLEFYRQEKTGFSVVLMRVIVLRTDRHGVEARPIFKSETLLARPAAQDEPAATIRRAGGPDRCPPSKRPGTTRPVARRV